MRKGEHKPPPQLLGSVFLRTSEIPKPTPKPMRLSRVFLTLLASLIGFLFFISYPANVASQGKGEWSPAARIPGYSDTVLPPFLVPDRAGNVHALASDWVGEGDDPVLAVTYRRWSPQEGWTPFVDVLLAPFGQARVQGALLDAQGELHLIFWGGFDFDASIYHSKALASVADRAQAWSPPQPIGPLALAPDAADMVGDGQGRLIVAYSGNVDGVGAGLYVVSSDDDGDTWSEPQAIFATFDTEQRIVVVDLFWGPSGTVHAVWDVVDARGRQLGGYYARLDSSGTWSEPLPLDESRGHGVANPAVIETEEDGTMVLYNNGLEGAVAPVMWMRRSLDQGLTWSPPVQAAPSHRGRNGVVSLVTDSAGQVHWLFGQRTGPEPAIHGMWHSVWSGDRWTSPIPVISGPPSPDFDPYDARATVLQGNILLVTWRMDPGKEVKSGAWYSFLPLNTPAYPIQPLPTLSSADTLPSSGSVLTDSVDTSETTVTISSQPEVPSAPSTDLPNPLPQPASVELSFSALLARSLLPSFVMLSVIFFLRFYRKGT